MKKIVLYFLLLSAITANANDLVTAQYNAECDDEIEKFNQIKDIYVSDRYKLITSLKLNKKTQLFIFDRSFSPEKSDGCKYSDPTLHDYLFVKKNKNEKPVLNKKLLSDLDYVNDVFLKKYQGGFSISIVSGQSSTVESTAIFKVIPDQGTFLKKIITLTIVPDGENDNKHIQAFPQSNEFEISKVELSKLID